MASTDSSALSRAKRLIRPVLALVAAIFVGFVIKDVATRFSGLTIEVAWGWVGLACLPSTVAVLLQYQAWWELVRSWTTKSMPRLLSLRVYVDGQMARYTPGKVGLPAVRLAGAEPLGVSPQVMLSTLLAEVLAWSACGSILGGLLVARGIGRHSVQGFRVADELLGYIGALSMVGLVSLIVVPRRIWPRPIVSLLGATGDGPLMPALVPAWQMAHFVASALSGLCVVLALGGTVAQGIYLGAVVCVAIVAGFLALLAPAGAGVREAIITVFAEPILGTNGAVALGLLARAVSLLSELALFVSMRTITPKYKAVATKSEAPQG